ncbi:hypothetical protein MSAN_01114800 [Mycena sanguinolenta]|uniref:Transmembrane protein n=1 Tax=Mycena sanguinolenta TaxID=230812 RepID=A0A8H6YKT8_9AGAR|nr:hypothetical protein MSAN_01114800 [Mycena sanguinolenta]
MSTALTSEQVQEVHFALGPWLIGSCVELLFQGVLSCQFTNYFSYYKDDTRAMKIVVAILAVLTTLKSMQSFAIIWVTFISYFGDVDGAILLNYTAWVSRLLILLIARLNERTVASRQSTNGELRYWDSMSNVISASACESSPKRWYVVVPVVLLFFFALLAMVVATYFIVKQNNRLIADWFAAHLSSVFAGDIILSLSTAYFLLKTRKDVLPQTVGLSRFASKTIYPSNITFSRRDQRADPANLPDRGPPPPSGTSANHFHYSRPLILISFRDFRSAMFNLIFSQITVVDGAEFISTGFNMPLPKLYAISMMWTLNARRTISANHSSEHGMTHTSNELSGARSRAQRRNNGDVELGAIQVVTQTETHIVRDIFPDDDRKRGPTYIDTKKSDDDSSVQDRK